MQNMDEEIKDKHELWAMFPQFKKNGIARLSDNLIRESDQENIKDLRLDLIAQKLDISPSYISRCYKNYFNLSLNESITRHKIEVAKKLLIEYPSLTMDEIAEKVGYSSGNYFIKVFKKTFKMTPYRYRKQSLIEKIETSAARAAIRKLAKSKKVRISHTAMHVAQYLYLFIRNRGIKTDDIRISLDAEEDKFFIVISAPGKDKPLNYKISTDGEEDF